MPREPRGFAETAAGALALEMGNHVWATGGPGGCTSPCLAIWSLPEFNFGHSHREPEGYGATTHAF